MVLQWSRERRKKWLYSSYYYDYICNVASLRYKLPQNLHRFRDIIFENFRVRMTSFYLTKLYPLSNFDRLYLRQYRSYEQASKHRCTSFRPEKGFWTSSGCHRYYFSVTHKVLQVKCTVLRFLQNWRCGKSILVGNTTTFADLVDMPVLPGHTCNSNYLPSLPYF